MSFIRNIIRNNNIKSKKIELSNIRQFTNFIKVYEPALLSINYDKYFDKVQNYSLSSESNQINL